MMWCKESLKPALDNFFKRNDVHVSHLRIDMLSELLIKDSKVPSMGGYREISERQNLALKIAMDCLHDIRGKEFEDIYAIKKEINLTIKNINETLIGKKENQDEKDC